MNTNHGLTGIPTRRPLWARVAVCPACGRRHAYNLNSTAGLEVRCACGETGHLQRWPQLDPDGTLRPATQHAPIP